MPSQIPYLLQQDIRVKELQGGKVILATEDPPGKVLFAHVSQTIHEITGYRVEEIKKIGLRPSLPNSLKDAHDTLILKELERIRQRGPQVRLMGSRGDENRTVPFVKKNGTTGSLSVGLYGFLIDNTPFLMGVLYEIGTLARHTPVVGLNQPQLHVFCSYGRGDFQANKTFPGELIQILEERGFSGWFDKNDIPLAKDFIEAISEGIEKSDNIIFLAAPYSVSSPYCAKELNLALDLGKRIIVIFFKENGDVELSEDAWNYIYPEAKGIKYETVKLNNQHWNSIDTNQMLYQRLPAIARLNRLIWESDANFSTQIQQLVDVLAQGKDKARFHTKLLLKALKWERNGRNRSLLISNRSELQQVEDWLEDPGPNKPIPIQCAYFSESLRVNSGGLSDVFLCHYAGDSVWRDKVRFALQSQGLSVWISSDVLPGGSLWQDEIYRGLRRASNLVFLASREAIRSQYCIAEISYAEKQNKPIYPIGIEIGVVSWLPENLKGIQAYDLIEDFDGNIQKLCTELKKDQVREYKRELAKLVTSAEEGWTDTKTPLTSAEIAIAQAWLKEGKRRNDLPQPPSKVVEMVNFSLKKERPIWQVGWPFSAGGGVVVLALVGLFAWLRPLRIPPGLEDIRDWTVSVKEIENKTGIDRERIYQCVRELTDSRPLIDSSTDLSVIQQFFGAYGFVYNYSSTELEIISRSFVCQWVSNISDRGVQERIIRFQTDDPGYELQLAAHTKNTDNCFAGFDGIDVKDKSLIDGLVNEFEDQGVATSQQLPQSILLRIMRGSGAALIVSCPFQTRGSANERVLGGYLSFAFSPDKLHTVNPKIILSLAKVRSGELGSILQWPTPVIVQKENDNDYSHRVALLIKSTVEVDDENMLQVDDPVHQGWIEAIRDEAQKYNIKIDIYDLPCQGCFKAQEGILSDLAVSDSPPDGILLVGAGSFVIGEHVDKLFCGPEEEDCVDIPVVGFDTPIESEDLLAFVGPDNQELAYKIAKWAIQHVERGPATVINGQLTQQNARDRDAGFKQALAEAAAEGFDIEYRGDGVGEWDSQSGYEIARGMLIAFPDLRLMLIANDEMAIGAHEAAVELGLRDQLVITGFDAIHRGQAALKEGMIDASISQGSETQARLAARALFEYLTDGVQPEARVTTLSDFKVQVGSRIKKR